MRFFTPIYSITQSALHALRRRIDVRARCIVLLTALAAGGTGLAEAQEAGPSTLRGRALDPQGAAVVGADAFLLETLEGTTTRRDGTFVLHTEHRGAATLVVRGMGYGEARRRVTLPRVDTVVVVLEIEVLELAPIGVEAGAFAMGPGEAEPLTPLSVVSTPGAHADVLQAVAALPGVQPVEEGAALHVRGGDVAETKVVLDGAVVLAPYRFESGLLSFGTFDPFDLESISFSSGGFGARHGDALSGLLELTTAGVPARREAAATVSLGALAGRVHVPLGEAAGIRLTANRSSTALMHRLNGHDTDFLRVPESRNAGGSAAWAYRRGGTLKLYGYDEWNRFSVRTDAPSYQGAFSGEDGSGLWVLSITDVAGAVGWAGSVSVSDRSQRQMFGSFRLDEQERFEQARGEASIAVRPGLMAVLGLEAERRRADLAGTYPETGSDARPEARTTAFASRVSARRWATFGELRWRPLERVEIKPGLRRDASSSTGVATWDPRVALVARIADGVHLTGAWGVYHQIPAPLAFEPEVGDPLLPSMRSTNTVVGLVLNGARGLLRVEAYHKRHEDLAQARRDYVVVGGGRGTARGVDIFARGEGPFGFEGRASYSFIDADRTDPNSGVLATSPFEIRHALTVVLERNIGERLGLASTIRYGSGRPHTPVLRAEYEASTGVWQPIYGAPMSERLAPYARIDLTGQFLHSFTGDDVTVFFASVTNVRDRKNVAGVRYSPDYSESEPLLAAFRRTFYFGVSTSTPF